MKSCKVLEKQHSRTFYCKMVRSFIEEIMGKNMKSRRIRSRNAKVGRTGRHLEGTHGSRGISAKTPCVTSSDKVGRNQGRQDAGNSRRQSSYD